VRIIRQEPDNYLVAFKVQGGAMPVWGLLTISSKDFCNNLFRHGFLVVVQFE